MRLGILAYATQTGLGYQTKDYCENLNPAKVMVVDLSMYNRMPLFRGWYSNYNTQWVSGIPTTADINRFLDGIDVVFMAETPLNHYLFEATKARGIKTVNAYNYEFLDYFRHPEWQGPTILAAPTVWNIEQVEKLNKGKVVHLPVPIKVDHTPRVISSCKTLSHIIGRPAVHDRNGTLSFLEAVDILKDRFDYVVYYQKPSDPRAVEYFEPVRAKLNEMCRKYSNIKVYTDIQDNTAMYQQGDLLVLPRRYGGLCLPMNEALSWGIPVVMTDVSPNNAILEKSWLAKSAQIQTFRGHVDIPVYQADVHSLVETIFYFQDKEYMRNQSIRAREIAEAQSWSVLKQKYIECFSG